MPGPTLVPLKRLLDFAYRTFTPFGLPFQACSAINILVFRVVRNPDCKQPVWPLSISLAATLEIDVSFSSYGYLDVSVPRVPLITLCIHVMIPAHYHRWVPPFRHLRICGYVLLPAAFRSLSRLSSAPSAKASS